MAGQNINQYVYPNLNPKLALESYDISLTSDERGFNMEVVYSPYLIAQTYGKKLPINFDINDPLSAQQLVITKGVYNPNNIFVSTNYYSTDNESLSCYTEHSSCDIGLTGIDNGLVSGMTGQTIYFTNGLVDDINKFNRFYFDKRLKLFQVTGNTSDNIRFSGFNDTIIYDVESVVGATEGIYHNLYGGFYQGFYKLFGYDYDILPDRVNKGWTVEMLLKPRITASTVNSGETTLNELYPDNKNTFFFLGARAENKFYHHADGTPNCFTGYTRVTELLTKLQTCACCNKTVTNSRCIYVYPPRSAGGVHDTHANYSCSQCNGNTMVQTTCGCGCDKVACETCGWECQIHECDTIVEVTPTPTPTPTSTSSSGCIVSPVCTPTCNTCSNCTDCDTCVYTGFSSIENTCETDPMYDWLSNNISLKLCGDIKNPGIGVRALRMTGDCSTTGTCNTTGITYTTGYTVVDYCSPPIFDYLVNYCNTDEPSILDTEHWVQINVVWERYSWFNSEELCSKGGLSTITKQVYLQSLAGNTSALIAPPYTNSAQTSEQIEIINLNENWLTEKDSRRGRLKIFVNGYLHHTIDDFEEVIPRAISTDKEKQVGVPFNISWGGGTQGLIENLTFTSLSALTGPYQQDPECFPTNDLTGTTFNGLETNILIERYFAGTFEGGISQFRFYVEPLSAPEVRHNFILLKDKFNLFNPSCPACSDNEGGDNCDYGDIEFVITTPTVTPTISLTPTLTKTPPPTKTPTNTPTPTNTITKTNTQTPTVTKTINPTPTITKTVTKTPTVTKTQTTTPTVTNTITPTQNGVYYGYDVCNNEVTVINGGLGTYYYEIYVGFDLGEITLNFSTQITPDKFQIIWNDSVVSDSGFRGDPSYNSQLNSLGYPDVVSGPVGLITFNKTGITPEFVYVSVLSPISSVNWSFMLSCPVSLTPTPTITKTLTPTQTITKTLTSTPTVTKTLTTTPTITSTSTPTISTTPNNIYTGTSECNIENDITNGNPGFYYYEINLGTDTGNITLNYNAFSIPDRFQVIWDGNIVIDTGFRGDPLYNSQLNSLGYPNVSGIGSGTATFSKNNNVPNTATVVITSPLNGVGWSFSLSCPPLPTPTPTITKTVTPTNTITVTPTITPSITLSSSLTLTPTVTPSITPTNTIDCRCYQVTVIDPGEPGGRLLYINCETLEYSQADVESGQTIFICAVFDSIIEISAQGVLSGICESNVCIEPTPTVTPTPTITPTVSPNNCLCFVVTNDTLSQVTIEYIDCYGNSTSTPVDPETIYNLCAQSVIDSGSLLYYQNGYCSDLGEGFGCDYVNTPTPTPTNTETPTTTVTPSTSGINELTPTPSVTITQTVTPTITPTNFSEEFISIWTASSPITLPYSPTGIYSGTIDWGDGFVSANTYANRTHNYTLSGDYTIKINGQIEGWDFNTYATTYRTSIKQILNWGSLKGENNSNSGMFFGCANLVITGVTDTPNLTSITATTSMFESCTSLTTISNLNGWDTSNVQLMNSMFKDCTLFNDVLSGWNTSSVINISNMFNNCDSFNQNINNWDVSSVTGMSSTFANTLIFNQPLSGWNVSNVTTMSGMFASSAAFNQEINNWVVSAVTNMSTMFQNADSFSQPLSGWDVSNVTTMASMFNLHGSFNQNINNWDVSSVTAFTSMFNAATSFNQPLSGWNTSSGVSFSSMFRGTSSFNQYIGNWNTSASTSMIGMFTDSILFNQDISSWDVSNVTNMSLIFNGATSFNQDLGNWVVSAVTSMSNAFNGCGLDTTNYDSILVGWSSQVPNINSNVQLGASGLTYSTITGLPARSILTGSPYNWVITGDTSVVITPTPTPTNTPTNTPTPTQTPTNTVTPTQTNTQSCPYVLGYFNTADPVLKVLTNSAGDNFVATTGGTEIYDSSYTYSQTLTAFTPQTYAYMVYDETNSILYMGSDTTSKSVQLYDFANSTGGTIAIGTDNGDVSISRTDDYVINLGVGDTNLRSIVTSTQSINNTVDITITADADSVYNRIDDNFWIVTTGDTLVKYDPVTKVVDTTTNIGNSGYIKRILYNQVNVLIFILVDGLEFSWYDGSGFVDSVSLTGYSGSNISMTYDNNSDKIYILNVDASNNFGLIKFDCASQTIDGFSTLGNYPTFTNGSIVYNSSTLEILLNFVPYLSRVYQICT